MHHYLSRLPVAIILTLLCSCYVGPSRVVYITATPSIVALAANAVTAIPSQPSPPTDTPFPHPTLNPEATPAEFQSEYVVQVGDTLSEIAHRFNTTTPILAQLNGLYNPNLISVGQVLLLPGLPAQDSPAVKTLPNSALIRGPGSDALDIASFIQNQPGFIREYSELLEYGAAAGGLQYELRSAAEIVNQVSLEYSIDPRILLSLLEYQGRWLSSSSPQDPRRQQPIVTGSEPPNGLYRQLSWAADWLNRGYYGWKYQELKVLTDFSGERYRIPAGLNAASVALQTLFSQINPAPIWLQKVSSEGFLKQYRAYFGDPFAQGGDENIQFPLSQPALDLPFARGETWYFTGGPHQGWGRYSPWSALDFAPPDAGQHYGPCFRSDYAVRAMAEGQVVYSHAGLLIQDLEADGQPGSGWLLFYLHLSEEGRASEGEWLAAGDIVGHPSCEGGFSTATHVHIARRYNGEWLPANCNDCTPEAMTPTFTLGGWRAEGIRNQAYQGKLLREGEERIADQGRNNPNNQISW